LNRLCQTAKEEDRSRPVVLATNYGEGPGTYGTDMIAHNFYAGWYWGTLQEIPKWVAEQRRKYPKGGLGLSEYGAGAGPSTHSAKPVRMDHSEEYQALFHEAYWKALEGKPWIWCKTIWVMFDFASDWRKEGEHPGINDKGLVTRDRKVKKDVFYWYKAHWNPEPLVYITSRRFTPRVDRNTAVKVYSNRAEVELSLNGKSLGKRKVKDCIALWEGVRLSPGENKLEASTSSAGVTLTDNCAWSVESGK
jgi:beta-galactosidase